MNRLYVWDEVLEDYTYGIAFAIAEDIDKAREQIAQKMTEGYGPKALPLYMQSWKEDHQEFWDKEPHIHELTEPAAYYVYGGS